MKQLFSIVIPAIAVFFSAWSLKKTIPIQSSPITVQYIGNMGVFITIENKKFLIDALHTEYRPAYLFPPASLADSIINGAGNYKGVWATLTTHIHRDHFSSDLTSRFLEQQPDAIAIVPKQAVDSFSFRNDYSLLKDKIIGVNKSSQTGTIRGKGYTIYAFNIHHTYQQRHSAIQNVGYIIDVNGKRVFHAGDTDAPIELYQRLKLHEYNIDVAILPSWLLCGENGKRITEELIKPKHIIVTHIEPGPAGEYITNCQKSYPSAVFFTNQRQQATF